MKQLATYPTNDNTETIVEFLRQCGFGQYGFIIPQEEDEVRNRQWRALAKDIRQIKDEERRQKIEQRIAELPEFILDLTPKNLCYAYRDLSFITNALINCQSREPGDNRIPHKLGIALIEVAKNLGVPPSFNYMSSVLFNAVKHSPQGILDNVLLKPINAFNEDHFQIDGKKNSEENFIRVHQGVEVMAVPFVSTIIALLSIPLQDLQKRKAEIIGRLNDCKKSIIEMRSILGKLHSVISPKYFQHVRKYLKGSEELRSKDSGIDGLFTDQGEFVGCYVGETGAQSPTMFIIKSFLNDANLVPQVAKEFHQKQLAFVTPGARHLLNFVDERGISFRNFVKNNEDCASCFSELVDSMKLYQKIHMKIVHSFIGDVKGTGGSIKPLEILEASKVVGIGNN